MADISERGAQLSSFHHGLGSLRFDTHLCCCTKGCETGDKFMGEEEIQV